MKNNICILLCVAVACLASCGQTYRQKQRLSRAECLELARRDSAALKVAVTPTMDCLPLFVAAEDSLFQRGGVDVHLKPVTSKTDCDTLLRGGGAEGAVADLVMVEHLKRQRLPMRCVAATNAYWQVVSNRLARIRELRQMSDKMIAVSPFAASAYVADMAVRRAKPKNLVYRIQMGSMNLRLKMLLNNEIDVAVLPEPQATAARLRHNPVLLDSRDLGVTLGVLAFTEKALQSKGRQKQIELFLKVYNQAVDSINKRGTAHYAKIIEKYTGADATTVRALPKSTFTHAAPPRQADVARAKGFVR